MSDAELSLSISGMDLRTLIMEIERDRQKEQRTTVFKKVASKYKEYRTKHRTLADVFTQDGEFQLLRDELKQKDDELTKKDEELREREDELMRAIARCSELEAALKAKEEELEVSGILNDRTRAEGGEGCRSKGRAECQGRRTESCRERQKVAMAEATALEAALRICRSERDNEVETSALKVARLEERIQGLEAELSGLNEQVVVLKAKEVRRQSQPYTSHTSVDPGIPRELYEMWVHAEAQLDVYKSFKAVGKVSEAELEGVRVKVREAREACGYAPSTPSGNEDDDDADRYSLNGFTLAGVELDASL
ncbi:uncharacterized protein [Nicotiana sylvestris]|uniref:uncharacterized protein n=1 Tax=Nicotiana sylvestris TaxID=4096 RepID=UPI00388CB2F9